MRATRAAALAVLALTSAAGAGCVSELSTKARPITGILAFQQVLDGSSNIYVYDMAQDAFIADSTRWDPDFAQAFNPSLSRDGHWVVFMARADDGQFMRLWAWNPSMSRPQDLTPMLGNHTDLYYEDPKLAPDDRHLVYKLQGAIYIARVKLGGGIALSGFHRLAKGARNEDTEASAPVVSADNKFVYFFRGPKTVDQHIERVTLDGGFHRTGRTRLFTPQDTSSYYPALRRNGALTFARHVNKGGGLYGTDTIYTVPPHTAVKDAVPAPFNLCDQVKGDVENADAAPVGRDLAIFSSTFASPPGTSVYSLFVGDAQGEVWDLRTGRLADLTGWLQGASYAPH